MSSCMDRLSQILSLAKSKKVTDYKKAIKLLLEFWDDNSETACEQITKYSQNPKLNIKYNAFSWNDIFNIVHELFIIEINRINTLNGNSGKLDKERIIKLVYSTTDKAKYYLKPKDVIISNLQILEITNIYIYSEFYEMYLGILRKYVLQERSQRILVETNQWQELLTACVSILKNVIININYVNLLQIIELIVQYGCSLSTLLFETKKLLPLIVNLLENYELYKIKSTDILFKLTCTVCQQIATDSRYVLSKFAENIPLGMISLKGPEEKYKLYLLLIQVHHPKGCILGDDICSTYNNGKWKIILNLLYKMILNDIKPIILSSNLISLACEVFRQKIFIKLPNLSHSNSFHENIYIQPKKKRRIFDDQENIIDLVSDKDPEQAWPIIQISIALYKKYPDCLKFKEYLKFLNIIIKFMNQACKNVYIMEDLCELATIFIKNEKRYKQNELKTHWDKVWDAVLRYLSMSHSDIIKKGCILVQNLIIFEKVSNPSSLLKLYLTKSIQSSNFSMYTLKVLCENIVIPCEINNYDINLTLITNNSLKIQLIQWTLYTLTKQLTVSSPIEDYSKILIGFTLKSWYKLYKNNSQMNIYNNHYTNLNFNFHNDMKTVTIEDIEQCYLSLQFKTKLPIDQYNILNTQILNKRDIYTPYIIDDLNFLIKSLNELVEENNADKDLSSFITKTTLIAVVISDLNSMKMIRCNFDEFVLVIKLKSCLMKIFISIKNINWSKITRFTLEITKSLILLYETKYDILISNIILKSLNFQIFKKIYSISKIEDQEFEADTKLSQCKINVKIILALYCCIDTGTKISELQIKIANTLLKLKKYNLTVWSDMMCVITILDIFVNISNNLITEEFIELLVSFIMELFEKCQKDNIIIHYLLQKLPKVLKNIMSLEDKDNVNVFNILLICKLFHDRFAKGIFGQLIHLSFVQCLNNIIKHNVFNNTKINIFNDEMFITFLNSPYYLVRLESLKYVYSIFSSSDFNYSWKSKFFDKLENAVYNIFLVQRELNADESQEERLLRSTSALQILAVVICSKSIFQNSALYILLRIVVEKDIDINIVKQIFVQINLSCECIIVKNLNYLLSRWCYQTSFESFPRTLLGFTEEVDFYKHYINIIFPILFREGKIHDAQNLCYKLDIPFEQIFKNCCSNIIPRILTDEFSEILKEIKDNLGIFEKIGNFSNLAKENLQEIIIQLVERLHDHNDFYDIFNMTITLPAFDPPYYNNKEVNFCFDRLAIIIYGKMNQSVFHFIITHNPSIVQRILLRLTRNIYADNIIEFKVKSLHQYVYFCSKIIKELNDDLHDPVATYFIKDVGSTLLNLVKENNDFITELVCKYLYYFFKIILPKKSIQVGNILNLCVKTLTPFINNSKHCLAARDILHFLLKEQRYCLATAIENLDSLPNILRSSNDHNMESQCLQKNVQHFLNVSEDKNCSVDNILSLKCQLIKKKYELEKLYEELENNQGFAVHCTSSILHRLIYRLIRLTEYKNTKIALEAAKCLGILGPADLSTMILHPQEIQKKESIDKVNILTRNICQILADFVISGDINLRIVSSDVLYAVLNTPWGTRVIEQFENDQNLIFLKDFLYPFRSRQEIKYSWINLHIDITEFNEVFCEKNLLWSKNSNESYNIWISNIASAVANCFINFYSKSLLPVFKLNVQFCELTLPHLISLIIYVDSSLTKNVCICVNLFFNFHFYKDENNDITSYFSTQKIQLCKAQDAIRCMLNVVNHLRIQTKEHIHLDFDYLSIAIAAQFCSAYFSSILYAELWCQNSIKITRDFDSIPIIDQIYEQENNQGKLIQNILKEAYLKIGDLDSIHGCGSSHLHNRKSRIPYYMNFKKLDKLILSQDIELSTKNSSTRGMVNALKESSLHYLAKHLLSATPMKTDLMEDLCYDSLWRLSDWSQVTSLKISSACDNICDFPTYHYEALKSLHENDNSSLQIYIKQAYFCIIKNLYNISLESCKAVYPKLSQLQMLHEIEELSLANLDNYKNLLINWDNKKYIYNNNFQYIEPILSQRVVMFQIQEPLKNSAIIKSALINIQLEIAQLAQQQGYLNIAARALENLSKQIDLDEETENRLLYHEGRLAWLRKDEDMARFNLRCLIKKKSVQPSLLAQALRIYGNWIADNKSENPQAIISKYYEKAINTYSSMSELSPNDVKDKCEARTALAQFAHEQYLLITEYIKSPQFERLKECIDYSRNFVPKNVKMHDIDILRAMKINTKQSSNDCIEMENIQKDRNLYLSLAIKNYLATLKESDEHDFLIFRLVSLWLDNMYDEAINKLLEKQLDHIPSYKFIVLIPQLAPHISNIGDIFTNKIFQVLERCAKEHPHHTLPTILALKNLYNDSKFCKEKIAKQEPRILGAQQLIRQLLPTNIGPIIQEMDRISNALVMLAYYDVDKKKVSISKYSIPKHVNLHSIRDFKHSIIPTITIIIKKNKNYTNIISVEKYESMYSNVGGINAPKKIICTGTDGIKRPQLVKGKDDLRQDAVMQQVFIVLNSLLKSNKNVKERKLYVRTYKVVPLTQRSGVLQWCENTIPLSYILTGDGTNRQLGLHKKYFPNDYTPNDCRKRLRAAKTMQQKHNIFMDCCKNLHPAFHYFFIENYLSPEMWFERRLAYTRSVATTSIIGYILGLGDRHVSNILIDKSTAEVIHIDFGIAFEQGKVLPTPETVPFRLTRDIEIAMGVSGIEGTMRRCCEETMTVLREQKEIIVTLLRVLLYDPLYSWAITPAKAALYQSEHSIQSSQSKESNSPGVSETNKLAERALLRIQQKLQGIEEGAASSIAGQVERLIQQARDPTNLSRLFEGWQAYL